MMSVCSPPTAQWQRRMLMERGSTAEEPRQREARRKLRPAVLLSVIAGVVGALPVGLLCVQLSVGGQVFGCTLLHCPSRTMLCFLLGCRGRASWWAQTQVCGDGAVVVEGRRPIVDALPLSRRPVPLFGWFFKCDLMSHS